TEVTVDIEATTDRASNSTCNSFVSNTTATPTCVTPFINTTATPNFETNIGGVECEHCSNKNRGVKVSNEPVNEFSSSYATKLSPTYFTKANLHKHEANVPQDVDCDIWLHAASVHKGVNSVLIDGPWMIRGIPIFLNKWSTSVSLLKEHLSRIPVWVKFHDVSLVAYTSDGLRLIATNIERGGNFWARVIKSIYGANGGLVDGGGRGLGMGGRGVWCDRAKVGSDEMGIDFTSSFVCKLGNGCDISFWEDRLGYLIPRNTSWLRNGVAFGFLLLRGCSLFAHPGLRCVFWFLWSDLSILMVPGLCLRCSVVTLLLLQ
nr:hypothetical protein [Tanacetum cinerariifolium]